MSRFLFPKWVDRARPLLAALSLGAPVYLIALGYYGLWPTTRVLGHMPTQPVPYSHELHAGQMGMDCRYCHTKVEKSAEANIPNVATCIGCHADGRLTKLAVEPLHKSRTDFIRAAYTGNQSIEWRRVHKLPDYVRNFPHAAHLRAGVSCFSCHGQINAMPVVAQNQPLSMGWCLDCHRNPEASLVSPDKVTQLDWVKKHLDERAGQGDAETKALFEKLKLNPPENCGACHY